jgi:hypothetical protein
MSDKPMTLKEAAEFLSVSNQQIYALVWKPVVVKAGRRKRQVKECWTK